MANTIFGGSNQVELYTIVANVFTTKLATLSNIKSKDIKFHPKKGGVVTIDMKYYTKDLEEDVISAYLSDVSTEAVTEDYEDGTSEEFSAAATAPKLGVIVYIGEVSTDTVVDCFVGTLSGDTGFIKTASKATAETPFELTAVKVDATTTVTKTLFDALVVDQPASDVTFASGTYGARTFLVTA